jgi:hypothetical protein
MLKRVVLAGLMAMFGGAAWADQEPRAVVQDPDVMPVVTREICTTMDWGYGEIRTDCRTEVSPAPPPDPKLKGICTTYYGRRTCY